MRAQLEQELIEKLKLDRNSFRKQALGGGDINEVWKVSDGKDEYAVKLNSSRRFPEMFRREAEGLELLDKNTQTLGIPKPVLLIEDIAGESALVLEWIESAANSSSERDLGLGLAELHRPKASRHGLQTDNYVGSLVQHNSPKESWIQFYGEMRLMDMAERAKEELGTKRMQRMEAFVGKLGDLLPEAEASLLHGDLWGGNKMFSSEKAWLIDPAVYYGHYEVDLAMTRLFGGFGPSFYGAYHSVTPLTSDWQERNDIYQLYPLLVHVNLFGCSYVLKVDNILKRFQ